MTAHYAYVWEFIVPESTRSGFVQHYSPNGSWGQLFRGHTGYIETILLHDLERPERFVTIDRWVSRSAYEAFRSTCSAEYDRLDKECEGLASEERSLGAFSDVAT